MFGAKIQYCYAREGKYGNRLDVPTWRGNGARMLEAIAIDCTDWGRGPITPHNTTRLAWSRERRMETIVQGGRGA